jgi:hypothetical protein
MARKVLVEVVCDICGAVADNATDTQFSFAGQTYKVDLCDDHLAQFGQAVQPFVDAAEVVPAGRRAIAVGATRPALHRAPTRRDPKQTGAIREWARANGFNLSDRGRIPSEVEAAYNARGKK